MLSRGTDSPSRVNNPESSVTPAHDSLRVGWAFPAISATRDWGGGRVKGIGRKEDYTDAWMRVGSEEVTYEEKSADLYDFITANFGFP